jgi:hypothetical protein
MTKTTKLTISMGVLIILGVIIYWYFPRTPVAFPSDKELIVNINHTQSTVRVEEILDKIKMDKEHFFVPFISTTGDYGTSYWEWQNTKWKVLNIDNSGEPKVWKIDSNDPSTFRLVWNLHEDDKVDHMKFFLYRERNFHITNGVEYYYPKLQMEKRIETTSISYGSIKLPNDWLSVIESLIKMDSSASHDLLGDFDLNRYMYFAWKPYDKSGIEARLEGTINGYSFFNDDIELDLVRLMDDSYFESSH